MMAIVVLVMKEGRGFAGWKEGVMSVGGEKRKVDVLSETQREAGAIL